MKHYRQHTTPNYKMGHHYTDHVLAMTQEDLHSKAEIAEELAARDMTIESMRREVENLTSQLAECQKACLDYDRKWHDTQYKLDECERERDQYKKLRDYWRDENGELARQLAVEKAGNETITAGFYEATRQLATTREALESIKFFALHGTHHHQISSKALAAIDAAMKVGADKTGEGS